MEQVDAQLIKATNLPITEEEMVALMKESEPGKSITTAFGPGYVALTRVPSNKWAYERLGELRTLHGKPVTLGCTLYDRPNSIEFIVNQKWSIAAICAAPERFDWNIREKII